jgi:putative pyruvate formate lyase activating enzyme
MMLSLQERGCHNINFVTPEHVVPQILEALPLAIEGGLRLPLVYNTSGYDSLDSIELMDGIVDIYMPDFKFWDPEMARHYVKAPNYPEAARRAIRAMHGQVGDLALDENGLALRGVLLRHLVMPSGIAGTKEIMEWVAGELGRDTYVNVMAQYYPAGKVSRTDYVEINQPPGYDEYQEAVSAARAAGLRRLDARSVARVL